MSRNRDQRPPVERAIDAAAELKPGSWESVESLAMLAIELRSRAESTALLAAAHDTASELKAGAWPSVRALAWLARADRELAGA